MIDTEVPDEGCRYTLFYNQTKGLCFDFWKGFDAFVSYRTAFGYCGPFAVDQSFYTVGTDVFAFGYVFLYLVVVYTLRLIESY